MIKGALFTLGVLAFLGGGACSVLSFMAASMADAPSPSDMYPAYWSAAGTAVGIGMMLVAWLA